MQASCMFDKENEKDKDKDKENEKDKDKAPPGVCAGQLCDQDVPSSGRRAPHLGQKIDIGLSWKEHRHLIILLIRPIWVRIGLQNRKHWIGLPVYDIGS